MFCDHVDAGLLATVEVARLKPLHDQHADRVRLALGGRFSAGHGDRIDTARLDHWCGAWSFQRQDREGRGMRFVDVVFEFFLDLGRKFTAGGGVPECVARPGDRTRQRLDCLHGSCTPLDRLLTTDGLESQTAALLDEHAHSIAADDPPRLVGEHKCRGHWVE